MKLAFGVLSFNHPGITTKCVRSLPNSDRVFLCHNGSEKKFVDDLTTLLPRLNHICTARNLGFSGGANFLLRDVFRHAEWCLFLTNDCELLSLPQNMETLLENLEPGLYAPQLFVRNTGRVDSLGGRVNLLTTQLEHCKKEAPPKIGRFSEFYVPGTAFLLHGDVFRQLEGFDESFHTYWEDVEFSLRANRRGWKLDTLPQVQIRHGVGKTCHGDSTYTLFHFQGNRGLFLKKTPWHPTKILALGILLFSWLRLTFRLIKQQRTQDIRILWRGIRTKLFI